MIIKIPRSFEYVFAVFAVWFFFGNPITLLLEGADGSQLIDTESASSNFLVPGLSMAIYGVAALLVLFRWKVTLQRLRGNPQFFLLVLLSLIVLASVQWSLFPNYTFRRSILFSGSTFFSIFLATQFSFKEQIKILIWGFGLTIGLSLFFGLFLPSYGKMGPPHTGAWRGVHMHKNKLGPQMAFIAVFLWIARSTDIFRRKQRLILNALIAAALFLVFASTSTGALVILSTLALSYMVFSALRFNYRFMVPLVSFLLTTIGLASCYLQANIEKILAVFGKSTDLTGRDQFWPAILQMISKKPLLGYGYQGFWQGKGSPAGEIWQITGWPVPNAHNGFLDLLLAVGLIGGGLFAMSFFLNFVISLKRIRLIPTSYMIYPAIVLIFVLVSNVAETSLFSTDSWIIYTWASLIPAQFVLLPTAE